MRENIFFVVSAACFCIFGVEGSAMPPEVHQVHGTGNTVAGSNPRAVRDQFIESIRNTDKKIKEQLASLEFHQSTIIDKVFETNAPLTIKYF